MVAEINNTFIKNHKCESSELSSRYIEQYRDDKGTLSWYLIKDSFNSRKKITRCPFCHINLDDIKKHYKNTSIDELSILIKKESIYDEDPYLTKTDIVQLWLDHNSIIASADEAGDKIQIRFDEEISLAELLQIRSNAAQQFKNVTVGIYLEEFTEMLIDGKKIEVNFIEADEATCRKYINRLEYIEKIS